MINIAQHCDKCKNITSHTLNNGVILCLKCKKKNQLKNKKYVEKEESD
jgi:ribosomal protein L37AE/L43A